MSRADSPAPSTTIVGLIGGGQLARMTAQAGRQLGLRIAVLDPAPDSPAGQLADIEVTGAFTDAGALAQLMEQVDIATYDIEHISTDALRMLIGKGHHILPTPELLDTIQDKLAQKQLLHEHAIPVPAFWPLDTPTPDAVREYGLPIVQKARRGGYDGRGVAILRGEEDLDRLLPVPSMLETCVELALELAVMVARGRDGEVAAFPVVEVHSDPDKNLLDMLVAPARVPEEIAAEATRLAVRTVEVLDGVGVFGVELLLSTAGQLFVNEVAPRPHNTGHYTIEACVTSQFEQHLRAVLGWPLGETRLLSPAVTANLLGAEGEEGPTRVSGLVDALAIPGVSVHLYGKAQTRPGRKMGHLTVIDDDPERALEKARRARSLLRIHAEPQR